MADTGKIIVKEPYYATQCEHCGWYGSSEDCGEINYGVNVFPALKDGDFLGRSQTFLADT